MILFGLRATVVVLFAVATSAGADEQCQQPIDYDIHDAEGEDSSLLQVTSNVKVGRGSEKPASNYGAAASHEARGLEKLVPPLYASVVPDAVALPATDGQTCHMTWERRIVPVTSSGLVLLPVVGLAALYIRRSSKLDGVHHQLCLLIVLANMMPTITIVESYKLAVSIGMSTSWSGLSVGIIRLGGVVGSFAAWGLWRMEKWHCWVQWHLVTMVALMLLGTSLYTVVVFMAASRVGLPGGLPNWLLFTRVLEGVSVGAIGFWARSLMTILAPREEQVFRMIRAQMATLLGLGIGPFLVSWMSFYDPCRGQPPDYLVSGPAGIFFTSAVLLVLWMCFPSVEKEVTARQEADYGASAAVGEQTGDPWLVSVTLVTNPMRTFVELGLEVATAYLLERGYGWSHSTIGLSIGAICMLALPVGLLKEQCKSMSITTFSWLLAIVTTLGCVALFDMWDSFGPMVPLATIFIGDSLVLPFSFLGDAVVNGLRNKFLTPPGTAFDAMSVNLYSIMAANAGMFLGPWVARTCLELGGRATYSACWALVMLAINALTQGYLIPRMRIAA